MPAGNVPGCFALMPLNLLSLELDKGSNILIPIVLEAVVNQNHLGVTVSNDLTPGAHISHITKKCNQRNTVLSISLQTRSKILYQSRLRPVLEYGSPVWNPWYKRDITELEKGQVSKAMLRPCFPPQTDHQQTGAGCVWGI